VIKIDKNRISRIRYILIGIVLLVVAVFIQNRFYYSFRPFLIAVAIIFLIIGAVRFVNHSGRLRK